MRPAAHLRTFGHRSDIMTVQSALDFIQHIRCEDAIRLQVKRLGKTYDLQSLVAIGKQTGFEFTQREIVQAFKWDWVMRAHRFGRNKS